MRKIRILFERVRFEWIYRLAVIDMNDAMTQARRELAAK